MFKKLIDSMESANYKAAAKGLLACPECGAKPDTGPPRADDAITCGACGAIASALEWAAAADGQPPANPEQPPVGTLITKSTDISGATVWNIPASGKSGGLMLFGIIWCVFIAVFSSVFLYGALFGSMEIESEHVALVRLGITLFLGIFWAVGLGMLYAGCRSKYARHRLSADRDRVTLRRELFGRSKVSSISVHDITSVAMVEFYQKNYQPVRGVEIRGRTGKLRFGSLLAEEEKAWLVADIRRVIRPPANPPADALASSGSSFTPPASAAPGAVRRDAFSIVLPAKASGLKSMGVMLFLMGIAFVCIGIFFFDNTVIPSVPDAPKGVRIFDMIFNFATQGFRLVWTLISAFFALLGLGLFFTQKRASGDETRIEGTDSEIAIRTNRHGRLLHEQVFPRPSVAAIRSSASGSSNGKTMKRVELIVGGKAVSLGRWLDAEKADAFVEEVRGTKGW